MALVYTKFRENMIQGAANYNVAAATVKAYLLTSGYTVNGATHQFVSDIVAGNRIGSVATLANKAYAGGKFSSDNILFAARAQGSTAVAIVIFNDTGTEATSPIICYNDGLNINTNGGDITVNCPGAGWAQF